MESFSFYLFRMIHDFFLASIVLFRFSFFRMYTLINVKSLEISTFAIFHLHFSIVLVMLVHSPWIQSMNFLLLPDVARTLIIFIHVSRMDVPQKSF